MAADYYVVYDASGTELSQHSSRHQAEVAARRLVESGDLARVDVYVVLPNFGVPPEYVESKLVSFGVAATEALFPSGPPRRERPSGLAQRQTDRCLV